MPASASSAAMNASASAFCFAANSLTSWVIFIEQNLGPHIEQKCAVLAPSAGRVWSWYCSAVSGSRLRLNWSRQRNSKRARSEEHTSELQSLAYLVCRLLLEKKKMETLD